ncbi:hypothetical protein PHLGIDRAFT_476163 [Phlebiopsis gigantea 11061_1 CR5-6]|uniref:MARVEL domain-containing protein n=1 Tax=Phlebiopsis gigantea (strain 11061_1 CR5-6) TaxID=745531 RepID=A0A0C3SF52_PHLG1|nr:hypothetical protein PHLGIDRAFT_476163 [Phlebiopsis gigantea 11061_1 CR5-6]
MPGLNEKDAPSLAARARPWLYGFTFALIFALTAAELGLDSHILHGHGNNSHDYPSLEFKNILGLILFTCIATLLYIVAHPWASVGMSCWWTFVFAVFWGASAGVLNRVVPFEVSKCGESPSAFPSVWGPWLHQCSELVALQGVAWTLWGIFLIKFIVLIVELIEFKPRKNVKTFYTV